MSKNRNQGQEQRGQALNRAVDPELIGRFIENQTKELQVRREENDLKQRELEYSYDHAKRLLDAQVVDRDKERQHEQKNNTRGALFTGFIFVIIVAAIAYALYLNKDQIVLELLKYIGVFLVGGLGGYSYRFVQDKKDDANKPNS
ncbi:MAG: hypothetical protein ACJ74Q_09025 [Pyrinomonadaceae bacterium]